MAAFIDYATTNLTQILAGLNVLSFLLGLLVAMIIYKPKLAAMKRYCEEVVKDKMAEKLRGIESLLGRNQPDTRDGKRIEIPKESALFYLRLLDDRDKPSSKYLLWDHLGKDFPETLVGNWRIDLSQILKPVLVQVLTDEPAKPEPSKIEAGKPEGERHAY